MNQTDVMEKREKMSLRLMQMKSYLIAWTVTHFRLSHANAEDVFSETCLYMIERGIHMVDLDQCFDAAIFTTMKRRAINHLRNSRRMIATGKIDKVLLYATRADKRDTVQEWDWHIDKALLTQELLKQATSKQDRIMAHEIFNPQLNAVRLSKKEGINPNTFQAAVRRARQKLKDLKYGE